eukprot:262437_1
MARPVPTFDPTVTPTLNPTHSPIYFNDGGVPEFVTSAFEEDAPNIIVNIVNDDKWFAIAIVVIVFMILCFVSCMYWIYHRYNSHKMNKNFNVMDVIARVSSPVTQTETTKKTGSDQIEIELVSTENIEPRQLPVQYNQTLIQRNQLQPQTHNPLHILTPPPPPPPPIPSHRQHSNQQSFQQYVQGSMSRNPFEEMLNNRADNTNCPNIHLPKKRFIPLNDIDENKDEDNKSDDKIKTIHIVHISDTHMRHERLSKQNIIPFKKDSVNILIHSGDFAQRLKLTKTGEMPSQIQNFKKWFASQPHHKKIIIAGNNEIAFNHFHKNDIRTKIFNDENVMYLQDDGIQLYGINFYGTPWTSSTRMGFSASQKELRQKWKLIPFDTDILITHLPPKGVMDTACKSTYNFDKKCDICGYLHPRYGHWGNQDLLNEVVNRIKPKAHLFGHVHQCSGFEVRNNILFINSAMDLIPIAHEFDVVFDL